MIEQAVILCGGSGGRLGTLTAELPRPLLSVDGAPFLDLLLFELGRHGIRRILLLGGFAAAPNIGVTEVAQQDHGSFAFPIVANMARGKGRKLFDGAPDVVRGE